MRLRYELSEDDFEAAEHIATKFLVSIARGSSIGFIFNVIFWIFIGIALMTVFDGVAGQANLGRNFVLALSGLFALATFIAMRSYWDRKIRLLRRSVFGPFPIEQELTLEDLGVRVSDRGGEALFRWEWISSIQEGTERVLLVTRHAYAIAIPASAFADASARETFLGDVRSRMNAK